MLTLYRQELSVNDVGNCRPLNFPIVKTRHDMAEKLPKLTQNINQSIKPYVKVLTSVYTDGALIPFPQYAVIKRCKSRMVTLAPTFCRLMIHLKLINM